MSNSTEARVVIATYVVPKENQAAYFEVMRQRRAYFLEVGYATDRAPIVMRSMKNEEMILEVFEWTSHEAVEKAHEDPNGH